MIRRMFLALSVVALVAPAFAAELEIGAKAPEFKALPGVDGKEYSLAEHEGRQGDRRLLHLQPMPGGGGL